MTHQVIGKTQRRLDAPGKAAGVTRYPADFNLPNQLYGRTLRTSYPHARIVNIDTSKARDLPGVVAVLTARDIPGHNRHGVLYPDAPVLADRVVLSVNDAVALVAAEDDDLAREALALIQVDYGELPAVFDPYAAMKPEAPRLKPDGNVFYHFKTRKGDVEKGFQQAKAVVEKTYSTQMIDQLFLQPEAALAYLDDRGHLTIQVATQYSHWDRLEIARALGLKANQVRVVVPAVGGAFGGREDITLQIHASLLAVKTGRPVKMTYSRQESFHAHSKRHPITMKVKTGADANGLLTALEAEIVGDSGAYSSWSPNIIRKTGVHITGPYVIPNVKVDAYAVYTNNPFTGAMRGFGAAQAPIAYESQMDALAAELGLHPFTIRWRNAFQVGSRTANGQVLTGSAGLRETMLRAAEAMGWNPEELK